MNASSASQQRFGRDVLIAGAANLVRSLRNLILVPIITGHLSLAHYGEWELLAAAIALIIPWITFSLNSALIRFLPGLDDAAVREGFYSIFFFVLLSSTSMALVLWVMAGYWGSIAAIAPLARNGPAIALILVSSSLLGVVLSYFRAFRQMLSHSALGLAQQTAEVLLIAYLLQRGAPLSDALWVLGATRTLLMTAGFLRIAATRGYAWPHFAQLRTYLAFAIPLIPNSLFYRLYDSADRFFLYAFVGSTAVGTYAVAYMAGSLFTTLVSPIHTVLFPTMAALWNRGEKEEIGVYLAQTIRFSALITFPALAGVAVLADPLLALLIRENSGSAITPYLLLSASFIVFGFGIPFGDLMATAGQSRRLFLLNGGLATINLLLNVLLIPLLGVLGAVISTLACHTTYALATSIMARSTTAYTVPWNALARTIIAAATMAFILAWLWGPQPQVLVLPILAGVALYAVLLFVFGVLTRRDIEFFASLLRVRRDR